jgi:GcrA cell cycle regulator
MASEWGAPETERLRELVFKELSASQIARRMSAEFRRLWTRNAIIGKISRLGLTLMGQPNQPKHHPLRVTEKKRRSGRRKQSAPEAVAPVTPVPSRRPVEQSKEARVVIPPEAPAPPPPYPGRSMAASYAVIALKPDDCRWPIGHVGEKDFRFCCAPRAGGNPYCEDHMVKAHGHSWY